MADDPLHSLIRRATGARRVLPPDNVQSLWSGYGAILRFGLEGGAWPSVIVKRVAAPEATAHPRGWDGDHGHRRKLRSYAVEQMFYRDHAHHCGADCRVPRCLAAEEWDDQRLMVLEDLDAAGFPLRHEALGREGLGRCLDWLAHLHATFMDREPTGLWPEGSYWHLATREAEWAAIDDPELKAGAAAIDARLCGARHRTLVHGDAKVANFCFSADGRAVAAVDFQYVGGGCGMRDVAYCIGSAVDEATQAAWEAELLDGYFATLGAALTARGWSGDVAALEAEWRELLPVAQADFHRFLAGWAPGHWKLNRRSERITRAVLAALNRPDPER